MGKLQKAIEISVKAHNNQTRKNGTPYVLHPLRLMLNAVTEEEMIVAVLHDTVEDTDITIESLKSENFSSKIITAIQLLTIG